MYCYVVIYDQNLNVLLAKKKITGARFEGKKTNPTVLNYSGQEVFPGGDPKNAKDTTDGALKEFTEETGVNLNSYIGNAKMWTKDFTYFSATFCYIEDNKKGDLVKEATTNIASGKTDDDELETVYFLDYKSAYLKLTTWDSSLTTPQAEQELSLRASKKKYNYQDKSWFKEMMDHLKTNNPF